MKEISLYKTGIKTYFFFKFEGSKQCCIDR